jgi:hypothetical protein
MASRKQTQSRVGRGGADGYAHRPPGRVGHRELASRVTENLDGVGAQPEAPWLRVVHRRRPAGVADRGHKNGAVGAGDCAILAIGHCPPLPSPR